MSWRSVTSANGTIGDLGDTGDDSTVAVGGQPQQRAGAPVPVAEASWARRLQGRTITRSRTLCRPSANSPASTTPADYVSSSMSTSCPPSSRPRLSGSGRPASDRAHPSSRSLHGPRPRGPSEPDPTQPISDSATMHPCRGSGADRPGRTPGRTRDPTHDRHQLPRCAAWSLAAPASRSSPRHGRFGIRPRNDPCRAPQPLRGARSDSLMVLGALGVPARGADRGCGARCLGRRRRPRARWRRPAGVVRSGSCRGRDRCGGQICW